MTKDTKYIGTTGVSEGKHAIEVEVNGIRSRLSLTLLNRGDLNLGWVYRN